MVANYLAAALRNLLRNRAYAALNLVGLSLGFAAALLIALYVRDEYSYDGFFPNSERIFQIGELIQPPGDIAIRTSVTASDIAPAMKLDFPEVDTVTRLTGAVAVLRHGSNDGVTTLAYWADANFFEVFPMRTLSGDLASALSQPDGIVLTRSTARRIFHRDDVAGEAVDLNHDHVLRVAAVIEDLPSNSHLIFDVLLSGRASYSPLLAPSSDPQAQNTGKTENVYSYVRTRTKPGVRNVRAGLKAFTDRHVLGEFNGLRIASAYTFFLTPLSEIHFLPRSIGAMKPPADRRTVYTLVGVALLILIVAGSNFISMMTARAAMRAVEVGLRRSVGATRQQIRNQFTTECLLYSTLAMVCGLIVVVALLAPFNSFLQRHLAFNCLSDPALGIGLIGATLLMGLAAGLYPSLFLLRYRPSEVLRGTLFTPGGFGRLRLLLVVLQFGTLIALLVATLTVHRQIQFITEDRLSLPNDEIYLASMAFKCTRAFTDSVKAISNVRAVGCASDSALTFDRFGAVFSSPNGGTVGIRAAAVDYAFFAIFGIKPLAGRLLSAQHGEDDLLQDSSEASANPSLVINESAAHALGFSTPLAAVNQSVRWARGTLTGGQFKAQEPSSSMIVGVISDFSIGSARDLIEPTVYYVDPALFYYLVATLDGHHIPEAIAELKALWNTQDGVHPFQGKFLSQYLNDLYADVLRQSVIFSAFTGVAVVIATLGLLGLSIFTAERRTKEIGLRKVMGASGTDILRFLGWQFARPVLLANLIAWPSAYFVMRRWLEGFAYHVAISAITFVIAGALTLLIALGTVAVHALGVARAKPVDALRYE